MTTPFSSTPTPEQAPAHNDRPAVKPTWAGASSPPTDPKDDQVQLDPRPQTYDLVLGGAAPPPTDGLVLGGLAGVQWRLSSSTIAHQQLALAEATRYGSPGLTLLGQALHHPVWEIQQVALRLLCEQRSSDARSILHVYEPPLHSAVDQDYRPLREMLAQEDWRAADRETADRVIQMAGREGQDTLEPEDMCALPIVDLRTIDRLWTSYSQGHFGFSVQKRLWQAADMPLGAFKLRAIGQLCRRMGWRRGTAWLYYDQLNFTLSAPQGHLPGVVGWMDDAMQYEYLMFGEGMPKLLKSWSALLARPEL